MLYKYIESFVLAYRFQTFYSIIVNIIWLIICILLSDKIEKKTFVYHTKLNNFLGYTEKKQQQQRICFDISFGKVYPNMPMPGCFIGIMAKWVYGGWIVNQIEKKP